ncbi:MAG TPA: LytTR family DNA-binding domain-containing protein [Vicinamibacteria bacterium]|nr:LytTR family DNA-binding domain-containing protein [Vicinamibacteria bacterium]
MSAAVVRALVVEDEAPARQNLREYLAGTPWVEVVGEAADGGEAVRLIDTLEPDLVFLDVRLPELSGVEVARRMRHSPALVFTTAYDRYAIAAFELGAIDYLVKPFGRERFDRTLARLRTRLGLPPVPDGERARTALEPGPLRRLFARQGDRIVPVATATIVRIQAQGDYAEVHAREGIFLIHVSLAELAARLDPAVFLQVHRSHIVNLGAVAHLEPHDDRRLALTLRDGSVVVASRAASEALRRQAR